MGHWAEAEHGGAVPGPCGETETCPLPFKHCHPWATLLLGAVWDHKKSGASLPVSVPPSRDLHVAVRTTRFQVLTWLVFPWQGVKVDPHNHVVVDEFQNTTRKGIYAIGDVCGKALLTPGEYRCPPSPQPPAEPCLTYPDPLLSGHCGREKAGTSALW